MTKKSPKDKTSLLRVTRSASVAADKIKFTSDAENAALETVCTRSRRRRKRPTRFACATAKKTPSGGEKLAHCEVAEAQHACSSKLPESAPHGSTTDAPQSVSTDLDSEGGSSSEHTGSTLNRHTDSVGTSMPPKNRSSSAGPSREDPTSHTPDGEISLSSESVLAQKATTENNFEEDLNYGLRRWNGRRLRTYGKAPFNRTAQVTHSLQVSAEAGVKRRVHLELDHEDMPGQTESSVCVPDSSPKSDDLGSVTESDIDCTDNTKTQRRKKRKGKTKVVRKGKTFTSNLSKSARHQRQSKCPRLNVDDNDWEDLDYANAKRVVRRSKIRTRNQGRRTVRYHDGEDDRSIENALELSDRTL